MNELDDLYQQIIIDHSQAPHNFRFLPEPTLEKKGFNPLCGDQLTLYLKIKAGILKEATFTGAGCAISIASASLMTDLITNQPLIEIPSLIEAFQELSTTGTCLQPEKLGKLLALGKIVHFPMRVKCATLSWHTLKQLLNQYNGNN